MRSMTGFGKGSAKNSEIEITAEIRTLNGKALRIRYSIPRIFNPLLSEIDETIKKYLKRGEVDLYLSYKFSPNVNIAVSINYQEALRYIEAAKRIGALANERVNLSLRDILSIPDVFQKEDVDVLPYKEVVLEALENALQMVVSAREKEGEKLKAYFEEKLAVIEKTLKTIENQIEGIEEKIFKRLKEKVQKLLDGEETGSDLEKRIELEVALLSEKQDVSEEVSRLYAHIERFRELLNEKEPVGKTLDFLCQEMHREINTLGNKIKEIDITDPIIKVKTEIARIKEQVQNVE
ncbi:MAG: YicC/YloC family endoribonuclease [Desulfurobacteriaceae bacterium]